MKWQSDKNTPNRTALITGASSGIGLEYSRQLAAKGFDLVMVSNEPEEIMRTSGKIAEEYKIKTIPYYIDLARPGAAKELFEWTISRQIQVDILINNAGIFIFREVTDTPAERIQTLIDLHISTVTKLCRLFAEDMKKRKKGHILNMSSMSCWMPMPGIALYTASKAYIRVFSRSLHYELKEDGITVTTVCPGGIATGLYNLPENLLKLGVRLGILMTPQKMVKKALKALFNGKQQIIPGWINRMYIPLVAIMPARMRLIVKHKLLKNA